MQKYKNVIFLIIRFIFQSNSAFETQTNNKFTPKYIHRFLRQSRPGYL